MGELGACEGHATSHTRLGRDAETLLIGNWPHWVGSGVESVLVAVVALLGPRRARAQRPVTLRHRRRRPAVAQQHRRWRNHLQVGEDPQQTGRRLWRQRVHDRLDRERRSALSAEVDRCDIDDVKHVGKQV